VCDEDLRRRLATDLDAAFEQLVLAYQHRLFAFALRICGQTQDAEEITQDALLRAYRALSTYPAQRISALAVRPWLFQITLNVARNRLRTPRPFIEPLGLGDDGGIEPRAAARDQPAQQYERAESERELAAVILRLPDRYRAAVVLRHVAGLGYGEIAAITGQPVGTIKANVHRGVRILRSALELVPSKVG
jgi:RNA polymerase sigma-70 factor (ECF subfamily)